MGNWTKINVQLRSCLKEEIKGCASRGKENGVAERKLMEAFPMRSEEASTAGNARRVRRKLVKVVTRSTSRVPGGLYYRLQFSRKLEYKL